MTEIDELKARIKQLEAEKNHIICLINKYFEKPCQYDFVDIMAHDFIDAVDGEPNVSWCEQHCKTTNFEGNIDCWKRLLNLLTRCENEQLEYGKEQYGRES